MLVFKSESEESAVLNAIERLIGLGLSPLDFSEEVARHFGYAEERLNKSRQPQEDNEITIRFPFCPDERTLTFADFVEFVDHLEVATIVGDVECRSPQFLLVRVEATDPLLTVALVNAAGQNPWGILAAKSPCGEQEISISLTGGVTLFGACVMLSGEYDEWFPAVLPEDLFVIACGSGKPTYESLRDSVNAFLFELSSSAQIDLVRARRHYITSDADVRPAIPSRLRPLLSGTRTARVLELYVEAMETKDNALKILRFVRLFEDAAVTMMRRELNERVKSKLESSRALQPDPEYVGELQRLFREFGGGQRQREAVKLVVSRCCDPDELVRVAPKSLKILRQKTDRLRRLNDFASMLVATRNEAAHGGFDASDRNRVCPPNEMAAFANCVQLAAQQVIRWYASD